jgi:hypothetical protein
MAILATLALLTVSALGAYKLTPKTEQNIDNELVPW